MAKVTYEYDENEERDKIISIAHIDDLKSMLYEIANYRRHLYKYETRGEIPVNEVIEELDRRLEDWFNLEEKIYY